MLKDEQKTKKQIVNNIEEWLESVSYREALGEMRKWEEVALGGYGRYFGSFINGLHESILIIDRDYRIRLVNDTFLHSMGYSLENVIGRRCYEVSHGFAEPCMKNNEDCLLEMVFATGNPHRCRHRHIKSNGSKVWQDINLLPLTDAEGNVTHVIKAIQDETAYAEEEKKYNVSVMREEIIQLEKQVVQARKMETLGTLASGIAHDFNNILSSIFGFTELALEDVEKEKRIYKNLLGVLRAGKRAKDLVEQILTFSRQKEEEPIPIQIKLIVKEALKLLRATIPAIIEIKQNIKSDSLVMGDPTKIQQVLMNLCINANYAMREKGGVLTVKLEDVELDSEFSSDHPNLKPGHYVELTVSDTGRGIPPDILNRIFDPFFTTKKVGEKTRMGLSVVRGIVESHGGTINAYSQPGEGSTFKIFLPAVETDS